MFDTLRERLKRIVQIQRVRYRKKGLFNNVLGILLLLVIVTSATHIGAYIWPQRIQNPILFVSLTSFCIHIGAQLCYFALYAPGYFDLLPLYSRYRINKEHRKPWQRKDWPQVRSKTISNLLLNQFIVYPTMVLISTTTGFRFRFDSFPSTAQVLLQLYTIYLIEDFFFYWAHRAFHEVPWLYKLHKVHHEYNSLYSLMTEYFHPFDFVVGNLMPSAIAFLILGHRTHCFMFFFWQCWKLYISSEGHSGYQFPWSPGRVFPCVAGASYHDYHHSANQGNYAGSCYLWDALLATNTPYINAFIKHKL